MWHATPINGCLDFLQPYLQGLYRPTSIYAIAAVDPLVAGAQRRGAFGAAHWTLRWSVDGARLCILRRLWKNQATRQNQDFDGRNPASQLRLVVFSHYFIIYRILYIPGVVVWDFFHQQYDRYDWREYPGYFCYGIYTVYVFKLM